MVRLMIFMVIGLCYVTSISAQPGTLEARYIEALASGQPLPKLSVGLITAKRPTLPRSRTSQTLAQALNGLRQQLLHSQPDNPEHQASVKLAYQGVMAVDQLILTEFQRIADRLSVDSIAFRRLKKAQRQYQDELAKRLEPLTRWLANPSSNTTQRAWQQTAQTIQPDSLPAPQLLRALPFQTSELPVRPLIQRPKITPSYHSQSPSKPTQDDLSGSLEAPLSTEILAKAKALNYEPIAIYEFVTHQVRREWYSGAMKGAVGTLASLAGNDIDQASLLIALFRAAQFPSRYVHGIAKYPIESIQNQLGVSSSNAALTALQAAGIAFEPILQGGQLRAVAVEHTWVSAYIPYGHYRGAVN